MLTLISRKLLFLVFGEKFKIYNYALLILLLAGCNLLDGQCYYPDVDATSGTITVKDTVNVRADGNYSTTQSTSCGTLVCTNAQTGCIIAESTTGIAACTMNNSDNYLYDPNCQVSTGGSTGTVTCSTDPASTDYNVNCAALGEAADNNTTGLVACSLDLSSGDLYNANCDVSSGSIYGTVGCSTISGASNYKQNCKVIKNTTGYMTCSTNSADSNFSPSCTPVSDPSTCPVQQDNNEVNSGKWINSGFLVEQGDTITVTTEGMISLCGGQTSLNVKTVAVKANNYNWTDTGIALSKGDLVSIAIGEPNQCTVDSNGNLQCTDAPGCVTNRQCDSNGNNCTETATESCNRWSTWGGTTAHNTANAWDPTSVTNNALCSPLSSGCTESSSVPGWNIRGVGLYGYIGSASSAPIADSPPSQVFYVGVDDTNYNSPIGQANSNQYLINATSIPCDTSNTSFTTLNPNASGNLMLRIWDCANQATCYNDNVGGYTVSIYYTGCPAANGCSAINLAPYGALQTLVTNQDPNTDCAVSGSTTHETTSSCGQYMNTPNGNNQASQDGTVWLRVQDSVYADNTGEYKVTLSKEEPAGLYSKIVGAILNIIQTKLFGNNPSDPQGGIVSSFFSNLTCSQISDKTSCTDYIKSIHAMMVLMVMFYGIAFLFGVVQISQLDLVMRVMKIGLILALTSPNSWSFFYNNLFQIFINGSTTLINMINGNNASGFTNPFVVVDEVLSLLLFSETAAYRLLALLFTSILGPIYLAIILYATFVYIKAIFKATIVYLMSFIAIALLLAVAPIFIPFILFRQTSSLFHNWLKFLIRYTLEPVILLSGLGILTQILLTILGQVFNFSACVKCAVQFSLGVPFIQGIPSVPLFCFSFLQPWGYDNYTGGPGVSITVIGLFAEILFLLIVVNMIKKFCDFSSEVVRILVPASLISPGMINPTQMSEQISHDLSDTAKSFVGMDQKSVQRRSGRAQIKERAKIQLEQNRIDATKAPNKPEKKI